MTWFAAWRDGIRRVNRAPAILAGVWVLTVLVSLPLVLGLRGMIEQHLGSSLAADSAVSGVNSDWWQEFSDQATGLGVTFKPTIIGFGAVLDNLSAFLDNDSRPVVIVGAASAYIVLWIFLAGGIIDRYARDRATRAHGFFAASGVFFFRFLRLAAVMWAVYAVLFGYVHAWLFGTVFPAMTRDVTVERTAFFERVGLYLVFGLLVAACNLIFDYAKVRAVVEDRRSMIGAIQSAIGFIRRNGGAAIALYLADFFLFLGVVAVYALVAPGASTGVLYTWLGFAIGQLYILARLWVKLTFWASETALFQGRLAHAGYVAAPKPAWPESPSAEAISRP
ncbi:MAG: hypothetical protein DMF91_21200 [Acidobacteria bacterium]|nr:MAG: hypothetical protein DMF91_21200 [Acidobacteriota bacterium]